MTRREVVYDDKVALAMSRFLDDPEGLAQVMDAVDDLADDPRPAGRCRPLQADRLPPAHRPADPEGGTQ
ncbi:MAG: hypothetical protein JWN00_2949 [Actinomycetia bacterium]|nr:hypothetical protein [Actinomycetes bacterium]